MKELKLELRDCEFELINEAAVDEGKTVEQMIYDCLALEYEFDDPLDPDEDEEEDNDDFNEWDDEDEDEDEDE